MDVRQSKTYDTQIIQHFIPIKEGVKPYHQKLRKVHPSIEPIIQKELTKLLDAWIIYKVHHSMCVSNLVPICKKSREIRLCVDFQNMNCTSDKYKYLVLYMDNIMKIVSRAHMFPLMDTFSGYNQVLAVERDRLKTIFCTKWGMFTYRQMLFGLVNAGTTF